MLIKQTSSLFLRCIMQRENATYLTKSNTVILFPIGLKIELPSGVNMIRPLRYTVPQRLENCGKS